MIGEADRVDKGIIRLGRVFVDLLALVRCMEVGPVGAMTIYLTCSVPILTIKLVWSPFMTGFSLLELFNFLLIFSCKKFHVIRT